MSRSPTDIPERLLAGDATDFERRVIDSALEKRPSAAASARMAKALGVTVTSIGTAAASKALAADAAASKATAAAGSSAAWPWVSVGVIGLIVAGAVVGSRVRHGSSPASPPLTAPPAPAAAPAPPGADGSSAGVFERTSSPASPLHRTRVATTTGDLRDEIALVDSARDALSVGSAPRALDILRRYQERYPSGTFRPEAAAVRIEALVKLGRDAEARALATRFVADQRGSLLATRVAELVGLAQPPVAP